MSPFIQKSDLESLPAGTKVFVKWSGGNGPWEYVLQRDLFGNPWFSTERDPAVVVGFPSEVEIMEIRAGSLDEPIDGIPYDSSVPPHELWPTYGGIRRPDWKSMILGEWYVDEHIDKENGRHILLDRRGNPALCGGPRVCKWCIEEGRK